MQQNIHFLKQLTIENPENKIFWYHLAKCYEEEMSNKNINIKTSELYRKKAIFAYKKALSLGYSEAKHDLKKIAKEKLKKEKFFYSNFIKASAFFLGLAVLLIPTPIEPGAITPTNAKTITLQESFIHHKELNEPLIILRSAIYQFSKENGFLPGNLEDLIKDFPNNYLSSIPHDSLNGSNSSYGEKNNTGGWLYPPPNRTNTTNLSEIELTKEVIQSVQPNNDICVEEKNCAFSPLKIVISIPDNKLLVVSGPYLLHIFPVALGKNNSTPIGTFKISKKIINPSFINPTVDNPFGTRGLELSDKRYAIHGTNDDSSIGDNVSHGCVRLTNKDIEFLYSIIPLYSEVEIVNIPYKDYLLEITTEASQPSTMISSNNTPANEEESIKEKPKENQDDNNAERNDPSSTITEECICGPIESNPPPLPPDESDPNNKYNWAL